MAEVHAHRWHSQNTIDIVHDDDDDDGNNDNVIWWNSILDKVMEIERTGFSQVLTTSIV